MNNNIDTEFQVVLIPVLYYPPDVDKISPTFNDSFQRMHWRTRQNLGSMDANISNKIASDYIFSMTYTAKLADYYLQLEDDISAALGYV